MRIVIVGGGEVGFNAARMLSGEGHRVVLIDQDEAHVERMTEQLDALVARTKSDLGGLDIAVANAGIVESNTDCMRMTEALWDRVQGVNLKGVFFTLQASAKLMLEQGRGGRLIAIASVMQGWASHTADDVCRQDHVTLRAAPEVCGLARLLAVAGGPHWWRYALGATGVRATNGTVLAAAGRRPANELAARQHCWGNGAMRAGNHLGQEVGWSCGSPVRRTCNTPVR